MKEANEAMAAAKAAGDAEALTAAKKAADATTAEKERIAKEATEGKGGSQCIEGSQRSIGSSQGSRGC